MIPRWSFFSGEITNLTTVVFFFAFVFFGFFFAAAIFFAGLCFGGLTAATGSGKDLGLLPPRVDRELETIVASE